MKDGAIISFLVADRMRPFAFALGEFNKICDRLGCVHFKQGAADTAFRCIKISDVSKIKDGLSAGQAGHNDSRPYWWMSRCRDRMPPGTDSGGAKALPTSH